MGRWSERETLRKSNASWTTWMRSSAAPSRWRAPPSSSATPADTPFENIIRDFYILIILEEKSFRNPNLRKKKQVKKKIFDNFLNFASKSSLRVTIWDNLSRWIVYVTLKLPTMHLTNDVTFKFNGKDYFAKLMQR